MCCYYRTRYRYIYFCAKIACYICDLLTFNNICFISESVTSILQRANHPVNYVDDIGWKPLHYAAFYKFDSALEIIVKAQAQASVKSEVVCKKITTPLCVAAKEGHKSTVIRLMELLPDLCVVANYEGQNILHLAAVQKNKKLVCRILEHCPQIHIEQILNGKDINGNTPMHLLIYHGCYIPELMRNNKWPVDMMIRNNKNWTPADMLYFEEEIIGDQVRLQNIFLCFFFNLVFGNIA